MVSSALLLMSSIPFCFLPRSLPVNEELRDKSCPKQTTGNGTNGGMDDNHNLKLGDIAKGTFFWISFFFFLSPCPELMLTVCVVGQGSFRH